MVKKIMQNKPNFKAGITFWKNPMILRKYKKEKII
jgi:hypothetical protein